LRKRRQVYPEGGALSSGTGDPLVYIASANLTRRNLTKGQSAMLTAMLHPEGGGEGGRGKRGENLHEKSKFSRERLRIARTVLASNRKIAEAVVRGDTSLDDFIFCAFARRSRRRCSQVSDTPSEARAQQWPES
jgi:hypothetical protein